MSSAIQRLRDKLVVSNRTTNAEAQQKDTLKLRLKTLEEGLKHVSSFTINPGCLGTGKSNNILGFLTSNGGLRKRSTLLPGSAENESANAAGQLRNDNSLKKKFVSRDNMFKRSIWASRSKVVHSNGQENTKLKANENTGEDDRELQNKTSASSDNEDVVSGFLYDRLQKEVISLRKHCELKDNTLDSKDQEIKMLVKKVEALAKALEVEYRKLKREAAAREKEAVSANVDDNRKNRNIDPSRRFVI